jgi:hypothetical protein
MKHGLSESVLNLFVQLLDQFDSAVSLRATGRASHMAATRELNLVAAEIGRTVRVMDAHNQQRFQNDGQLLGTEQRAHGAGQAEASVHSEGRNTSRGRHDDANQR